MRSNFTIVAALNFICCLSPIPVHTLEDLPDFLRCPHAYSLCLAYANLKFVLREAGKSCLGHVNRRNSSTV